MNGRSHGKSTSSRGNEPKEQYYKQKERSELAEGAVEMNRRSSANEGSKLLIQIIRTANMLHEGALLKRVRKSCALKALRTKRDYPSR